MAIYLFDDMKSITRKHLEELENTLPDERRTKAQRYRFFNDRLCCVLSYKLLEYGLEKQYGIKNFSIAYREDEKLPRHLL